MVRIPRLAYKIHDSPHCPWNLKGLRLFSRSCNLVLAYFPSAVCNPFPPLTLWSCSTAPSQEVPRVIVMVVMIRQVPLAFTGELSMVLDMFGLQSSQKSQRGDCVNQPILHLWKQVQRDKVTNITQWDGAGTPPDPGPSYVSGLCLLGEGDMGMRGGDPLGSAGSWKPWDVDLLSLYLELR